MPNVSTNTKTRTSHSLTIRVNGVTIGQIQKWSHSQTREIKPIFELNSRTSGNPVDNVPGNIGALKISIDRYDLYDVKMEQAFGSTDFSMLTDQTNPFQVVESWKNPNGTVEVYIYDGCWFSSIGRTMNSTGDRTVLVSGELTFLNRTKQ